MHTGFRMPRLSIGGCVGCPLERRVTASDIRKSYLQATLQTCQCLLPPIREQALPGTHLPSARTCLQPLREKALLKPDTANCSDLSHVSSFEQCLLVSCDLSCVSYARAVAQRKQGHSLAGEDEPEVESEDPRRVGPSTQTNVEGQP